MTVDDLKKQGGYKVIGYSDTVNLPKEKPKSIFGSIGNGLDAVFGGKQIGESLVKAGTNVKNLATGGIKKFNQGLPENTVDVPALIGDYTKAGSNFIPGVAQGANFATKVGAGAATGYAMDVGSGLKNKEESPFMPGVGTAIAGALPVAGAAIKPATAIVSRLFKGLGSGLSGVSEDTIDRILNNPEIAKRASQKLAQTGNERVLETNARTFLNGVSQIKKEARASFGKGLEALKETDIDPKAFRGSIQPILQGYAVVSEKGKRVLGNVEFTDPKNIKKASELINSLSKSKMDGVSLRKLADDIENSKYKIATSDERLSFNAFINDISGAVKEAINKSTGKLDEINKNFSSDMQLAEAVENIFGKVNYKNLPELVKASKKLEGLFAQKGLEPEVVDNFLKRLGMNPEELKTSEAIRQISQKSAPSNTTGLSFGELARGVTSAVVTPEMVKNLSIATGLAEKELSSVLQKMKTPARNLLIQALLQGGTDNSEQVTQ